MGFYCCRRSVVCMMLMLVSSNALAIKQSSLAATADSDLSMERIQARLVNLEGQLSRRQMVVSTVNNPLIKEHCTVDMAAYGYDDSPMFGYVRTNGGSLQEVLVPGDITRNRGVTLFELDATTCTTRNRQTFDTYSVERDRAQLVETLEAALTGTVIVGVTADSTQGDTGFETSAGPFFTRYNMDLSGMKSREKFAFIMQKGYPKKTIFQRKPNGDDSLRMKIALRGSTVSDVTFKRV